MSLEKASSNTAESDNDQPGNYEQAMNSYPPFNKEAAKARVAEAKKDSRRKSS